MCRLCAIASIAPIVFVLVAAPAQSESVLSVLRLPSEEASPSDAAAEHNVLSLEGFESLALAGHPSISELAARVRAARCACYQAGLPPNPSVGYMGSEIGNEGTAGLQGAYLSQKFIRGGKLALDQAVQCQEVRRLEQELAAQRYRVATRIRTAYFNAYLAQREVDLSRQLVGVSTQAVESVQALFDAQEARRTDVLQAQIEQRRIVARLSQAEFAQQAAWRRLAAVANQPDMAPQPLVAELTDIGWQHDWEETRRSLLAGSPEVATAVLEIKKATAAWRRACAEPTPDVTAQLGVQYDDSTQDTVANVQIGLPLPLWNRNQGGVGEACNLVSAARRRLETLELSLTQKLADRMQAYQAAQVRADAYRGGILIGAEENLNLVRQAYEQGESSYLDLLTVQRTYFESNLDYLDALREVNASVQLLRGFLLGGEDV